MTQASTSTQAARAQRRETPTHLFSVGQTVRLKGGFGRIAQATDIYQITATLPPRGTSLQYRIRSDEERHERVATQDSLEIVDVSAAPDDATLLERTFSHGQGTDAQLARDQEAKEGQGTGEA